MSEKQKTIKHAVSISGVGLHTGNPVILTFQPAPENYGYKFRRTDLNSGVLVDADVDHVVDTSRGTSIEQDGSRIDTISYGEEHPADPNHDEIAWAKNRRGVFVLLLP